MHTVVSVQTYARCLFFPPRESRDRAPPSNNSAESQTTSIPFPIRALRLVSATPPRGKVCDLGTVRIPNPRCAINGWKIAGTSALAQKAHACFQRMNSWDGNLSDLPSCLDLGLRQSASNLYRYWIGRLQIPKRPRNITRSLSQSIGQRCHRRLRHGDWMVLSSAGNW